MPSDLWGDGRSARRARLAVGALILFAVAIGMTAPEADGGGVAVALGLVLVVLGWVAWSLLPQTSIRTATELSAISVGGAAVLAGSGRGAAAAIAFPLIAVAAAAERLPMPLALVVATTAFGSLLVGALLGRSGLGLVAALVIPPAGFIAGLAPRQHVERAEQAELLLAESQRAREEQARAAALGERVRIAREIHDVLAHSLAALSIQLEVAQALLADRQDPEAALLQVERAQQLVAQGMADTRDAVAALRTDAAPLPVELERLLEDYANETGTEAALEIEGEARELPADAELACRRIAQEALTNARKHARGARVTASLAYGASGIRLLVRNTRGTGPSRLSDDGGGYGIAGMRERAALLQGRLTAGMVDDEWEVELWMPA